jgi:hypothetical protein
VPKDDGHRVVEWSFLRLLRPAVGGFFGRRIQRRDQFVDVIDEDKVEDAKHDGRRLRQTNPHPRRPIRSLHRHERASSAILPPIRREKRRRSLQKRALFTGEQGEFV